MLVPCKSIGVQCNVGSKRTSPSVATSRVRAQEGADVSLPRWKSELPGLVLEKLFLDCGGRGGGSNVCDCKYINPSGSQRVRCRRLWWVSCLLTDSLNQDLSLPHVCWHRKVDTSTNDATSYESILGLSNSWLAVVPAMQSQYLWCRWFSRSVRKMAYGVRGVACGAHKYVLT